ncbi:protein-disulfide isomerase [Hasllibacter halocynthiae]|uniref:Protein-disulfide isomerase n=1 Tax=Hasllibacter halocynthiae TaxID=595589 RepID=A0A2T0X1H5_9RHOB|nr:DsbA family protein [Hasllibacter halocynthiae]PRY92798.1 protein-disulfide isomerase [Hasllibacter halocynthiae]
MNTKIALAAGAVAAAAGAGFWLAETRAPSLGSAAVAQEAAQAPLVEDIAFGDADAPVTIVEYASYTCPHCARFHEDVYPVLKEEYVDTGQVRFEHREVFFDRFGLWAAMIARCDGGSHYSEVVDLVYDRQSQWTQGDPATVAGNLRAIGAEAGLAPDAVEACMSDPAMAEALVANYEENAARDGIRSTPSFLIDGELVDNMPIGEFRDAIDAALEG